MDVSKRCHGTASRRREPEPANNNSSGIEGNQTQIHELQGELR